MERDETDSALPAKAQEIVLEVTEEEYAADLARGLQDDEVLHPGRHVFRRGSFLERHDLKPEDARRSTAGLPNDAPV